LRPTYTRTRADVHRARSIASCARSGGSIGDARDDTRDARLGQALRAKRGAESKFRQIAYLPPTSPPISTLIPAAIASPSRASVAERRDCYRASVIVACSRDVLARKARGTSALAASTGGCFFPGECERPSAARSIESRRCASSPSSAGKNDRDSKRVARHASRPPLRPAFRRARCVKRAKFPFRVAHRDGRIIRARIPQWSCYARTPPRSLRSISAHRAAPKCTRMQRRRVTLLRAARGHCTEDACLHQGSLRSCLRGDTQRRARCQRV